jgi:hypothetical protein
MKQTRPDDDTTPNRSANMEKAEGSRENVDANDDAGGITNRPLSREQHEQEEVPPRGQNKEGGHA